MWLSPAIGSLCRAEQDLIVCCIFSGGSLQETCRAFIPGWLQKTAAAVCAECVLQRVLQDVWDNSCILPGWPERLAVSARPQIIVGRSAFLMVSAVFPWTHIVLTCHIRAATVQTGMFFSEERWCCMPISCRLRVVLAQLNLERAKISQPALSLRRLALESGVSLSVLVALNTGKSQRIDYATIDRLLMYFNRFLPVSTDDLLRWEAVSGERGCSPTIVSGRQLVQSGQG